jgi:hypothetical protein
MADRKVITFDSEEEDDWIRSPQVTKGHPSDAELFGKKLVGKKITVIRTDSKDKPNNDAK